MAHTQVGLIPHLVVSPATEAIEFYKRAFGFKELNRMPGEKGQVIHCAMQLGEAGLMLADDMPGMTSCRSPKSLGGTTVTIHINWPDVDALFEQATKAGATAIMRPTDMFWGDRYCKLADPFGHHWSIATHKEDLTPEEMNRRGAEFFKNMAKK
jgi:uncharacterized glyoxalase superfamily protein PhnB